MSRDDGFAIADTDTSLMSDPKVVALARRLRDSVATMAAVGLYDAVRLASWKAGERLTLDEALPGWWLDPVDDMAAHLIAVGLLDAERRIPVGPWQSWFVPAYARRDHYRQLGAKGGKAKASRGSSEGSSEGSSVGSSAGYSAGSSAGSSPYRTDRTVPTEGTGTRPRATTDDDGFGGLSAAFIASWTDRGFRRPPTVGQRDALWGAVDACPTLIGDWVRDAPPKARAAEVVGYVLKRWHERQAEVDPDPPPPIVDRGPSSGPTTIGDVIRGGLS